MRAVSTMIRYALKCAEGHVFDAWFRDSAAFDTLAGERRVTCAVCGEVRVEKSLMAPSVRADERPATRAGETPVPPPAAGAPAGRAVPGPLSAPATPAEAALAGLRRFLSEKVSYVGRQFADEARSIHLGEAEERPIWGEATPEDARALQEDGVPVAPLPWLSRRDD